MYEEVDTKSKKIELKENVAYGPVKQDQTFELKENVAYGPVKQEQEFELIERESGIWYSETGAGV